MAIKRYNLMQWRKGHMIIECMEGDITNQPGFGAIVNAANARLTAGNGVSGAIHRAAGPGLAEACRPFAPIEVGQAIVTPGFNLPNRFIIHVLGPVYACEEAPADKLTMAYHTLFTEAQELGIGSVALPPISTGEFGYPLGEAGEVVLDTVEAIRPALSSIHTVCFVFETEEELEFMAAAMERRWGEPNVGGMWPEEGQGVIRD